MINKLMVQGRLVRDVELLTTTSGAEVAKFTVAWSKKIKETESKLFINCTAWRQMGIFITQYFKKGQEIVVEGELTCRDYEDKQGNKRTAFEVTVDKAHFCGAKGDGATTSRTSATDITIAGPEEQSSFSAGALDGFVGVPNADGDFPF